MFCALLRIVMQLHEIYKMLRQYKFQKFAEKLNILVKVSYHPIINGIDTLKNYYLNI
jgi:hypothetical protein